MFLKGVAVLTSSTSQQNRNSGIWRTNLFFKKTFFSFFFIFSTPVFALSLPNLGTFVKHIFNFLLRKRWMVTCNIWGIGYFSTSLWSQIHLLVYWHIFTNNEGFTLNNNLILQVEYPIFCGVDGKWFFYIYESLFVDTVINYLNLEVMEASVALISVILHCLQPSSVYSVIFLLLFSFLGGRFSIKCEWVCSVDFHSSESNKPTNLAVLWDRWFTCKFLSR